MISNIPTILITVSPMKAFYILNGMQFISVFKVPVPCVAYIGVSSYGKGLLQRNLDENKIVLFKGAREIPLNVALSPMSGVVVAKCEITGCEKVFSFDWQGDEYSDPRYHHTVSDLTILDEPMTISQFYTRKSRLIKATPYEPKGPRKGEFFDMELLKHSRRYEYTNTPLTRLPSRWQFVEVDK